MPMTTTRANTHATESQSIASTSAPLRFPFSMSAAGGDSSLSSSPFTSVPASPQSLSFQDRLGTATEWPLPLHCSPHFLPNQQAFGTQSPADTATAAVAPGAVTRTGYSTRSATGMLPRPTGRLNGQLLGANGLMGTAVSPQNNVVGGTGRKRRRRYGPKPEPPYLCFCGKQFKRHEHMLRHRATHDDSIKYECRICGKCFRRQDVMHRHTMTHASRNHLQSKLRNSSASSYRLPGSMTGIASGSTRMKSESDSDQHQHGHLPFECSGGEHNALEDPSLRVGLGDPFREYNEDHRIAAAQLQSACSSARYSYAMTGSTSMHPTVMRGASMNEAGLARSEILDVMTDYRSRSAVSPPPAFCPAVSVFSSNSLPAGSVGGTMAHTYLPTSMGSQHEYNTKPAVHEAGHAYTHGWSASYGLPYGSVQLAPESEWSEQSLSGPSTHTFASPAWSQKADLTGRESAGAPGNRTPLSMLSSRQLSADPGARWHQQLPQYVHHQQPQQQQLCQPDSPLLGATSAYQYNLMHRSPSAGLQRRLSGYHAQNGWSGSPHDARGSSHDHSNAVTTEAQREGGGPDLGLGLFNQNYASQEPALLRPSPLPNVSIPSGEKARTCAMRHPHTTPIFPKGEHSSSSTSHQLGTEAECMPASQDSAREEGSDASELRKDLTSMSSALEANTGSFLTEVSADASTQSDCLDHGQEYQEMSADARLEQLSSTIKDQNDRSNGYTGNSSSGSESGSPGGRPGGRRW